MGAIDGQAQEVLIWLGSASKDTSLDVHAFHTYAAGDPKAMEARGARHVSLGER
jgi:hypothetical protein